MDHTHTAAIGTVAHNHPNRWMLSFFDAEGEIGGFVEIFDLPGGGKVDQASTGSLHSSLKCQECRYHHGKHGVICALHPDGWYNWEEQNCPDWE